MLLVQGSLDQKADLLQFFKVFFHYLYILIRKLKILNLRPDPCILTLTSLPTLPDTPHHLPRHQVSGKMMDGRDGWMAIAVPPTNPKTLENLATKGKNFVCSLVRISLCISVFIKKQIKVVFNFWAIILSAKFVGGGFETENLCSLLNT
jgi:hypothetical protein